MRYLITGSCGFLGFNLSKKLLELDHTVYGIDNFITGSRSNLNQLCLYNNFIFQEQDICMTINYPEVDYIYNLACPASPIHYSLYPIETMDVNYMGIKNLLNFCLKNKIGLFQSSTSEIYGDPLVSPQSEKYFGNVNSFGPRSCYDCGKKIAEALCFEYIKMGCNVHIGRIFNTYGPYMQTHDGRVISEFIVQALRGEDIIIYGDGSTTRSFCYVDDMIEAFLKIANTNYHSPINLGNPEEYTLLDLANIVIQKTNSNSKIIFKNFKQDDPKKRKPDIDLAKKTLLWEPQISLEEGLDRTINYFSSL